MIQINYSISQIVVDPALLETELLMKVPKIIRPTIHSAFMDALSVAQRVDRRRPKTDGRCVAVWNKLDELAINDNIPTLQEFLAIATENDWNLNNSRIEYYEWRHTHGIYGRLNDNESLND